MNVNAPLQPGAPPQYDPTPANVWRLIGPPIARLHGHRPTGERRVRRLEPLCWSTAVTSRFGNDRALAAAQGRPGGRHDSAAVELSPGTSPSACSRSSSRARNERCRAGRRDPRVHREARRAERAALDGPRRRDARHERCRRWATGPGAIGRRSPRAGEHWTGPAPAEPAPKGRAGRRVRGHPKRAGRAAGEHWTGPRRQQLRGARAGILGARFRSPLLSTSEDSALVPAAGAGRSGSTPIVFVSAYPHLGVVSCDGPSSAGARLACGEGPLTAVSALPRSRRACRPALPADRILEIFGP